MPGFVRYGHIWIIHSLVPLREGIYDSYTPLVIVQEYTQTEHPFCHSWSYSPVDILYLSGNRLATRLQQIGDQYASCMYYSM